MFEVNRLKLLLFLVALAMILFFYFFGISMYTINPPKPTTEGAIIIIILSSLIFLIDAKYPSVMHRIYELLYRWNFQTGIEALFLGIFLIIIMAVTDLKFSWVKYIYPHSIEISLVIFFLFIMIVVLAFGEWRQKHKIMTK